MEKVEVAGIIGLVVCAALLCVAAARSDVWAVSVRLIGTTAQGEGWYLNIPPDTEGARVGPLHVAPRYVQLNYGVRWDTLNRFAITLRNGGQYPIWVRFASWQCAPWESVVLERQDMVIMPGKSQTVFFGYLLSSQGFETPVEQIAMSVGCSVRVVATEVRTR